MDEPVFRSSVADASVPSPPGIALRDESSLRKTVVRAGIGTAAKAHLAVAFGSSRTSDHVLIAGTRPDEWILLGDAEAMAAKLDALPTDGHVSLVDWTHGRAAFRLRGDRCRSVLEKLCDLDLSDSMTPDGAVAGADVAGTSCVMIRQDDEEDRSYLLLVDRSFGRYLFYTLVDAMAEFG